MVRPIITAALALLLLAAPAGADLDLTPIDSYYLVEGGRAPCLEFHNSGRVVCYTPPGNWKPGGSGKQMTLTPPDAIQASASIEALPAGEPLPVTEQNMKAYGDMAVKLLPREASNVVVVEAAAAGVQICGYPLAKVTMTYKFFGQDFETAVFFMPRPVEDIRFRFTCHTADFKDLYRLFERSLFSIMGL